MKILILNRRDIANPAGGGAELYTHEVARGLVREHRCEVLVMASRFRNARASEVIDGVRYIRKGNEVTVHLWGLSYAFRNRKKFDYIIDEFNGIGFFTFLLPESVLLIHQMYKEFWFRELGMAGALPYVLEPLLLRLYRRRLAITVSASTEEDLRRRGFERTRIVMNAISNRAVLQAQKDPEPTVVFLGRLKSTKRPEDAIEIFRRVKKKVPDARLWIMGAGPSESDLRKRAEGLADVTFWGWVSNEEKMALLGRAHVLVVPSVREGFGINVIEAASAGTPAVGYNVPGLRDSIKDGQTGYLADSAGEAATMITELLSDQSTFEQLSRNCIAYSREFEWRNRVDEFWGIIGEEKK